MYKGTRRKVALYIMLILAITLAIMIAITYIASTIELNLENDRILRNYIQAYELPEEGKPYEYKDPPVKYRLYSVAFGNDGDVISVDDDKGRDYSQTELINIASEIRSKNKVSGNHDNWVFRNEIKDDYKLIAFMRYDAIKENFIFKTTLIAGIIFMILMIPLSYILAKMIIRPIARRIELQKQFLSDVGHELKTPISIIGANTEVVIRESGSNKWLENIKNENERMGSLVKSIMELAKNEENAIELERIDLSRIVSGEALMAEEVAFEKGYAIKSSIEDKIFMTGNEAAVKQLLEILLDNAISHSEGEKVIEISLAKEFKKAYLKVINSGKEMSKEERRKIFERFYRIDEARNGAAGHYGLGLSIARSITEMHKGTISCDSRNGKIIFTVVLPVEV